MRVTSWGTRYIGPKDADDIEPNQGGIRGTVDQIRGFSTENPVRSRCRKSPAAEEASDESDQFDVSLAATSARATMTGVDVRYGDGKTLFVQFDVAICSTPDCADV